MRCFFYLCFPLAGGLIWRWATTPRRMLTCGLLLFLAEMTVPALAMLRPIHGFGDLMANVEPTNIFWAAFVKYDPLFRLGDFLMGILVARVYQHLVERNRSLSRGHWLYLPAACIWVSVLCCSSRIPYPLLHNGLLTPVFACVVLGFALGGIRRVDELLSHPLLVLLGQASYALYILQYPLWRILNSTVARTMGPNHTAELRFFPVYATFAVIGSVVAFRYLEEPFNQAIRQKLRRTKRDMAPAPEVFQKAAGV